MRLHAQAADPEEVVALHDMRIAAKRLRYILEVTGPVLRPLREDGDEDVKELQDLLGEIHDCDVQVPETAAFAERLLAEDGALNKLAGGAEDLDPGCSSRRRTCATTPASPRSRRTCARAGTCCSIGSSSNGATGAQGVPRTA